MVIRSLFIEESPWSRASWFVTCTSEPNHIGSVTICIMYPYVYSWHGDQPPPMTSTRDLSHYLCRQFYVLACCVGSLVNPSVSRGHAYPHLSVKDLKSFWLYVVRLQGSPRHHKVLTLSLRLIGFLRALANSCNMSWAFGWRYPG